MTATLDSPADYTATFDCLKNPRPVLSHGTPSGNCCTPTKPPNTVIGRPPTTTNRVPN